MISRFIESVSEYFAAAAFVHKQRLYRYFLISGIISLVLGGIILCAAYATSGSLSSWMHGVYPWDWGREVADTLVGIAGGVIIIALGFILYKHLLMVLVSPFMGPLSAKVEAMHTGISSESRFSVKQISYEMIRGVRIAFRNVIRESLITIGILLLGLIPVFSMLVVPMIFLVQAYYVGFGNTDYFLERRTTVSQSIKYIREHKALVLGNGVGFMLLLMIPIAGLFLAPVLGTVAATLSALRYPLPERKV